MKCIDDEIPFGWEWTRLKAVIIDTNAGKSPNCEKRPRKSDEWGVLTTTSIQNGYFLPEENKVLPCNFIISKDQVVNIDDILITRAGPRNRTGIVCVVDKPCKNLILSDKTVRIDYFRGLLNPYYIMFALNSPDIHDIVMKATVGMASSQVNISQNNIKEIIIPLPSLSEQSRIVQQIQSLSPLINRYLLYQLELDTLNNTLPSIIKKSILQEAIQGKLVPQIAEERTAEDLLELIKQEKQHLVKEGKLKKSALTDSVIIKGDDNKYYEQVGKEIKEITEEIAFDLPNGWHWCRLKDICSIFTGATFKKEEATTIRKGIRILRGGNISPFELKIKDDDIFLTEDKVKTDILLKENDILTPAVTSLENIGKMARVDSDMSDITVGGFVFIIRLHLINRWFSKYILCLLSSPFMIDFMKSITNKSGQAFYNIGKERLSTALLPIPPLAEQYRIVAQIEKLFEQLR